MSPPTSLTTERLEEFINEHLKEDLAQLEKYIEQYNEEIMEFVQLKNTIETLGEIETEDGFKTQMEIGGNMFMEARVPATDKLLVDVGKGYYLELNRAEAMKFADAKVKILNKECDILREESVKKRAEIKLALMCMGEQQQLHAMEKD